MRNKKTDTTCESLYFFKIILLLNSKLYQFYFVVRVILFGFCVNNIKDLFEVHLLYRSVMGRKSYRSDNDL